jgi:hypothetical protein
MKTKANLNNFATVEEEILNSLKNDNSPYSRSLITSCLRSIRNSLEGEQQLPDNLKYLKKVKIFSLFS